MRKVQITSLPKNAGSTDSSNIFFPNLKNDSVKSVEVNHTLKPVEWDESNTEAELGEQVVTDMNGDGLPENYRIGGNRHYDGGTPLKLPNNSFVFSRDNKMKIKDENILKMFGMSKPSTPADIAKKYDLNTFRKVLADNDSDHIQIKTAESMIANYNEKLGKLALVQESMKGFPDGIPPISIPYFETSGFNPADIFSMNGPDNMSNPDMARYGKNIIPEMYPAPMKFGGWTLPKAQAGKSIYDEDFLTKLLALRKNSDASVALPKYLRDASNLKEVSNVPGVQKGLGKGNVYGKMDWASPEMMADFKARNAWYLKQNPDFNPNKKSDVLDFQKKYNQRTNELGLGSYLKEDSKFGQYTFSTPNLDIPEGKTTLAAAINKPVDEKLSPVNVNHLADQVSNSEDAPYWLQDIIKTAGAFGDLTKIKKYLPWQAATDTYLTDPTFYDPTRELAANAEESAIGADAAGMFGGAQSLNARLSQIQGQGLKAAADILGKYNNLNVGVANEFEMANKSVLNQSAQRSANNATNLYDKTVIANQNFDNARAMARGNVRQSIIDAITNRGKTQALNSMFPQYKVDPSTGGIVSFTKGKGLKPSNDQTALEDKFNELLKNPHLSSNPELAYKIALKSLGSSEDSGMNMAFMKDYNNQLSAGY